MTIKSQIKLTNAKQFIVASVACAAGFVGVARGDDLWTVYQTALAEDAAYRAAELQYQSARRGVPIARGAFLPAINVTAGVDEYNEPKPPMDAEHSSRRVVAGATWRVFDVAAKNQLDQAKHARTRAAINFEQARHALILRSAERYFRLLAAHDNYDVARRQQTALARQKEFASERLNVGVGTKTDLFDADARYQQARADFISAEDEIVNARFALAELLAGATPPLAKLRDDAPLDRPTPDDAAEWVMRALDHNLALRAAQFDVAIAKDEIARQRAAFLPRISLTANHERSTNPSPSFNSDSTTKKYGASATWQLFSGGANLMRARRAAFDYDAAEQLTIALRREVESTAQAAYRAVAGGVNQVAALSRAVRAGESALRAKQQGFRAGITTNLEVLDAQRDLAQSRSDYFRARYDFILAVLRLEQSAGDLNDDDVRRVNGWLAGN